MIPLLFLAHRLTGSAHPLQGSCGTLGVQARRKSMWEVLLRHAAGHGVWKMEGMKGSTWQSELVCLRLQRLQVRYPLVAKGLLREGCEMAARAAGEVAAVTKPRESARPKAERL